MLKLVGALQVEEVKEQPPSGGCVLKRQCVFGGRGQVSATFGRLCVETVATSYFKEVS